MVSLTYWEAGVHDLTSHLRGSSVPNARRYATLGTVALPCDPTIARTRIGYHRMHADARTR